MEERLADMKEELERAKFKYEKKQLYELEDKERMLLNRVE